MTYQIARPSFKEYDYEVGHYTYEPEFSEEAEAYVEGIIRKYAQLTESEEQDAYIQLFKGYDFLEKIQQLTPFYERSFGMNDIDDTKTIILWLFLIKVQTCETKERLRKIAVLVLNKIANDFSGSLTFPDISRSLFMEITKFLLKESAVKEVGEAIKKITTIERTDPKHWKETQLYIARVYLPLIMEKGKLHTYRNKEDRFNFLTNMYRLYKYEYCAYSLATEIYDLLYDLDKEKAIREKERIEQAIEERSQRTSTSNLNWNDSWNDSRSHWDEYDEDGIPYSDYD